MQRATLLYILSRLCIAIILPVDSHYDKFDMNNSENAISKWNLSTKFIVLKLLLERKCECKTSYEFSHLQLI